jgi:hypothetical protein
VAEEEDFDTLSVEKWDFLSGTAVQNYKTVRAGVKSYREVGNNSVVRHFGTSKSSGQRHDANIKELAKSAASHSQPIKVFFQPQTEKSNVVISEVDMEDDIFNLITKCQPCIETNNG